MKKLLIAMIILGEAALSPLLAATAAERSERMEIDFLIAKPVLSRRRNISPVEVKSSKRYDHTSLDKFLKKYHAFLHTPYVLHPKDMMIVDGVSYLPLYMTPCL